MSASLIAFVMPRKAPPTQVIVAYTVFVVAAFQAYHKAEQEFSVVLTMAVMFQCLAVALLFLQSLCSGSAAGISAQALMLEGWSLVCRLSNTTWKDGYLPVDKTGDFLFQAIDVCSLIIVVGLLYRILKVQKSSYQASEDSLPIAPIVLGSVVLGMLLRADMNDYPLFDSLWMAGLFMGALQILPQLWLIQRTDGCVNSSMRHYVGAMTMSRLCSGLYMWHAYADITCAPLIKGINHAPAVILAAHALDLFLLGDFALSGGKFVASKGFASGLELLPVAAPQKV